jgi:tRNA threonylcarbamoyl adenosine modification protein (Sua5/YciO/YrdC/YwlC family)
MGTVMAMGAEAIDAAMAVLRAGLPVAVPTDTVYGLAVDPTCEGATENLFIVKGRPESIALPVLVAGLDQADVLVEHGALPGEARRLALSFWPGALTMVVPRDRRLHWKLGGDDRSIGLRCPAHSWIRQLCRKVGALATTSANRHGEPPLTTAGAVVSLLGKRLALVVDGGACEAAPSTVLDLTGPVPEQLRPGGVLWSDIEAVVSARS